MWLVIPPKPFQNTTRTLPKSIKDCENRFKIATSIISQARTRSERAPKSIFYDFLQFSEAPGPPKIDPKPLKSIKKRTKNDVRKNNLLQHYAFLIFRRFGLPKRIQNQAFPQAFSKTSISRNPYKTLAVRRKIKIRTLKNHQKIDSTTRSADASQKVSQK